jgi:hypothetical protein
MKNCGKNNKQCLIKSSHRNYPTILKDIFIKFDEFN